VNKNLRLLVSFVGNDKLSGSLRSIIGLGQTGTQKLAAMKRTARDLDGELRSVQRELGRSSGNVTELMGREADLQRRIASTNDAMERQVRLLRAKSQADSIRARGEALKSSGQSDMMQGAAIAGGLFAAGKGAMDFQSGMTDIALKANLSKRETAGLQANILAAAKAAHQLPEAMRAGVDVLAGFGMTPQQATQMIAPIGKVATAYRAEIGDLAAASNANMQNLKVPIGETARALEIMAAAGNAGAFEVKDMAQYFPTLTAQAQAFGQKGVAAVADLAAAAQIARKGTGDSSTAANNLQNLMSKINTEDTIKKFAKFGIDLPAAMKKAYAEGKTPLEGIAELSNKAVGGDLSKLSFLFGDMQAQSALRPLIQNMAEYRKIRSEALASKGAVDEAFARRSEDAAVKAGDLGGALQTLAITAGPVLLPPMVAVAQNLVSITSRIGAWMQANPRATSTLIHLVGGLGAFKLGLGAAKIVLGSLFGPLATVWKLWAQFRNAGTVAAAFPAAARAIGVMKTAALGLGRGVIWLGRGAFQVGAAAIGRAVPLLSTMFSIMRSGALLLARGVMQAGLMMLANPMVLAIVAIVAALGFAGYMIYRHWDTIKAAFTSAMNWFAALPGRFASFGRDIMNGLLNGITERVNAIKSLVTGIAGKVTGWFKGVLGIKSPSRVFMGLGGHITDGLAIGLQRGQGTALQAAHKIAKGVAGVSMAVAAPAMAGDAAPANAMARTSIPAPAAPALAQKFALQANREAAPFTALPDGKPQPQRIELSALAPIRPRAAAPAPASGVGAMQQPASFGPITIQIYAAPGQSPQEIAAVVEAKLRELDNRRAAAARSAYVDD